MVFLNPGCFILQFKWITQLLFYFFKIWCSFTEEGKMYFIVSITTFIQGGKSRDIKSLTKRLPYPNSVLPFVCNWNFVREIRGVFYSLFQWWVCFP